MRIVFAGTAAFAVPVLHALCDRGLEVVAVFTKAPRPQGRGLLRRPSPVHTAALARGIPVYTPPNFCHPSTVQDLVALQPDWLIVTAYGVLLPDTVLRVPMYGCMNVHASLLPRWRGAAPIQRAILAGDLTTGITIMQLDTGLDTGPICLQKKTDITTEDTALSVHDRLAAMGAQGLLEALSQAIHHSLVWTPQEPQQATYAEKIKKEEALVNWHQRAEEVSRHIRAFYPWPGAYTYYNDIVLKLVSVQSSQCGTPGQPGEMVRVRAAGIDVATGKGCVCLTYVQKSGGRVVSVGDFLSGFPLLPGSLLTSATTAPPRL